MNIEKEDLNLVQGRVMCSPMTLESMKAAGIDPLEYHKTMIARGIVDELMKQGLIDYAVDNNNDLTVTYRGKILVYKKKEEHK